MKWAVSSELLRTVKVKDESAQVCKTQKKKTPNLFRLVRSLTAFLLLGLLILQDAQCQARVEAAELVGEERQEAPAEI